MSRVYGRDLQIARDAGPVSDTRVGLGWFPRQRKDERPGGEHADDEPAAAARTSSSATGMFQLPVAVCSSPSSSGPALATR